MSLPATTDGSRFLTMDEMVRVWQKRLRMQDWEIRVWTPPVDTGTVLERVVHSGRTGAVTLEFEAPSDEREEADMVPDTEVEVVAGLLFAWAARLGYNDPENARRRRIGVYNLARALVQFSSEDMGPKWYSGISETQSSFREECLRVEYLRFWQKAMRLQDWKMELRWCAPWEMPDPLAEGCVEVCASLMDARIEILKTECQKEEDRADYDPEAVLVHEMAHIHAQCMGIGREDGRSETEEMLIEGIVAAFLGIRRGE